ncbi:MAG: hypothetical protein C0402_15795 [Thermodesulfovibrio sp.]|nr:hypothetical protein [Thermodesulfovibrio sp.]
MPAERNSDRSACHELVEYTVVTLKDGKLRFLDLTGRAINRSKTGLCFITRYPLKSGYVLEFRGKVLQRSQGIVMWIRNIGGIYMAGTRLIEKSPQTIP